MKKLFFFATAFFLAAGISLNAQNAVISKVDFTVQSTLDVDFWDDTSEDFKYETADKAVKTIRTVDTLFSYAQDVIEKKLKIDLDKKTVAADSKLAGFGKMTGFPNEKIKDAVASGKYDKYLDMNIQIVSGGATTTSSGPFSKKKQKVDMIVNITVYDKKGKETAQYKKRTRMDEVKMSTSLFGFSDEQALTGNEIVSLFENALDNALGKVTR
ncbi:MAG: hypothetical protein HUU34_18285 [Saprospiraceae bacterium]|nr:hypothetical protein [Saprospiraceae bacterium]